MNFTKKELTQWRNKWRVQKSGATRRGIEWHFSFEEWMAWWGDDILRRGNKSNDLVMARSGDVGPYHPTNVRKATVAENTKEAHCGRPSIKKGIPLTEEHKRKLSIANKGQLPWNTGLNISGMTGKTPWNKKNGKQANQ